MSTKTETSTDPMEGLTTNDSLPTLWVDGVRIATREDGMCAISFDSELPQGVFEQVRIMTSEKMMKAVIDQLCASLDYYPQEEE